MRDQARRLQQDSLHQGDLERKKVTDCEEQLKRALKDRDIVSTRYAQLESDFVSFKQVPTQDISRDF